MCLTIMSPEPDFTRVNCTAKLFAMYAAEKTREDPEFIFTARQIGEVFGCTEQAAMNIIRRNVGHGTFERDDKTDKIMPYFFKITEQGIKYGEYLQGEENRKLSESILNGRR